MSTDLLSFEHPSVLLFCLSIKLNSNMTTRSWSLYKKRGHVEWWVKMSTCVYLFVWRRIFIFICVLKSKKYATLKKILRKMLQSYRTIIVRRNVREHFLSSNSRNIYFARLIMVQHIGKNIQFWMNPRRNETFCEMHANSTPNIDEFGISLQTKIRAQKILSVTSSF